jgi:hypothetical protein
LLSKFNDLWLDRRLRSGTVMRRRGFARVPAVCAVLLAFASVAVERSQATVHVDQPLAEWMQHPTSATVRAVVHVREGAVGEVTARLRTLRVEARAVPLSAGVLIAQLTPDALSALALDRDVIGLLSDAAVRASAAGHPSN